MIKFPSHDNQHLIINNIIDYEPIPLIGKSVICKVAKITPVAAFLLVTHIENKKVSLEYKVNLRLSDLQLNILENQYIWDKLMIENLVEGIITSYGDSNGMNIMVTRIYDKE